MADSTTREAELAQETQEATLYLADRVQLEAKRACAPAEEGGLMASRALFVEGDAAAFDGLITLPGIRAGQTLSLLGLSFITSNGTDYTTQRRLVEVSLVEPLATDAVIGGPFLYGFTNLGKRIIRDEGVPERPFTLLWQPGENTIPPAFAGPDHWNLLVRVAAGVGTWRVTANYQWRLNR